MQPEDELKSLKRGLRAVLLINDLGSVTISELGRRLELPRTTAERVLRTLESEMFVERDPVTKRFFLTSRVRALSHGYSDESWIAHVATPLLFETTRRIGWPLGIATPLGERMSLRVTTDPATSMNIHRRHIGSEIAMARSSSGQVFLAFLDDVQRSEMLALLRRSDDPGQAVARDETRMAYLLDEVRRRGYSFGIDDGRERSVSVPIFADGKIKAVLLMMFIASAISYARIVEDFVPKLRAMAASIEADAFVETAARDD
ncbi:helix-turn-helix domain-containing protein [Sphingomonas sp. CGMCC 1.13654]|uniref:Helix-turn-helix domain-containing protein n=1 Tax=Sphingomonas chungangi TaxID=2683589 RepID=A0A838L5Q7_9SPHN|nr:helix-turn-helix domain-containing protein [Sphingomonas chungangi]MBA2934823.1 helix-turn-helix domain-containing protein [Sphingomonas chungangi]MVW58134.1 helix-turn-helix domain-containing protein [Sphingomonas chungangi]